MQGHPVAGVEILADIDFPWDILPMVRNHHEQWSGRGYPDGLAGEAIPLAARILCVADVYDALTSERPYRAAYTHARALEVMRSMEGELRPGALRAVRGDRRAPPRVADRLGAGPGRRAGRRRPAARALRVSARPTPPSARPEPSRAAPH
jgi:hypothetical protein